MYIGLLGYNAILNDPWEVYIRPILSLADCRTTCRAYRIRRRFFKLSSFPLVFCLTALITISPRS